jgi:hypothetical protein
MASLRPSIDQGILGKKEFQLQGVKVFAAKGMFATKTQRREEDLMENFKNSRLE